MSLEKQLADYGRLQEELFGAIELDEITNPLTVGRQERTPSSQTLFPQGITWRTRYAGPAWAVAAFVSVLAVGAVYLLFFNLGDQVADNPPPTTVAPESETLISPRLAYGVEGDIYLADWDGANAILVADGISTNDGCGGYRGEGTMWAPDGRHFAYRSGWDDACLPEVHVRDAQGRLVASVPGFGWDIGWSPDSNRFATWIEFWKTIAIYGLDGERQALLTVTPGCSGGGDIDPMWTPDGQSVLVPPCEFPVDGGTPLRTTAPESLVRSTGWTASWSPDGTRIAYVKSTGDGETYESSLVIAEANGTVLQVVHDESAPSEYGHLVWSPSGDRVLFTWTARTEDGDAANASQELRQVEIGSGHVTVIAAEPAIQAIRFSADGDQILFTTSDDGYTGLWSINADGSDMQLLVPNTGFGDWQPHPGED